MCGYITVNRTAIPRDRRDQLDNPGWQWQSQQRKEAKRNETSGNVVIEGTTGESRERIYEKIDG